MFGIDDAVVGAIGGSLVTGLLNNSGASDRMDAANQFSAQQYATRYQTTMKDMAAAGLNPMLAYSGISGTPPSGAMANPGGYPDFGQSFNAARQTSSNIDLQENQSNLIDSQIELNSAQTKSVDMTVEKTVAEVKNLGSTFDQIVAITDNLRQQKTNLMHEDNNLVAQYNVLYETAQKIKSELMLVGANIQNTDAQTALYRLQAGLTGMDLKAAQDMGNLGRQAGQLKPIIDILMRVFGPRSGGITINK